MRYYDPMLRRLVEVRDRACMFCRCYEPTPDNLMRTPIPGARGRDWICFFRHEVGCPPRGYSYQFELAGLDTAPRRNLTPPPQNSDAPASSV